MSTASDWGIVFDFLADSFDGLARAARSYDHRVAADRPEPRFSDFQRIPVRDDDPVPKDEEVPQFVQDHMINEVAYQIWRGTFDGRSRDKWSRLDSASKKYYLQKAREIDALYHE